MFYTPSREEQRSITESMLQVPRWRLNTRLGTTRTEAWLDRSDGIMQTLTTVYTSPVTEHWPLAHCVSRAIQDALDHDSMSGCQ